MLTLMRQAAVVCSAVEKKVRMKSPVVAAAPVVRAVNPANWVFY